MTPQRIFIRDHHDRQNIIHLHRHLASFASFLSVHVLLHVISSLLAYCIVLSITLKTMTWGWPSSSSSRQTASHSISCGELLIRDFQMSSGCQGEDCQRKYMMYLPTSVCQGGLSTTTPLSIKLPLVFSIHCLGCTLESMRHWAEMAELYQFVWVNPEGLHRSFNAGGESCCGYALQQGIDDFGFLKGIIEQLSSEYSSFVSSDWTYAMGWSNGGYMVSAAASLFRAIAPISGYQVETINVERPTAIMLHHADDDSFVQPTGCCTDNTMPQCCCHLSDTFPTCTSVQAKMDQWATQFNGCTDPTPVETWHEPDQVTCHTYQNCQANTTFCIHQHKAHFNRPSFAMGFPMNRPVADFFARHMCLEANVGAIWDSQQRVCTCDSERPKGPYCFNTLKEGDISSTEASIPTQPDGAFVSPTGGSSTSEETPTIVSSTHHNTDTMDDDGTWKAEVGTKEVALSGKGEYITMIGLLSLLAFLCIYHRRADNRTPRWRRPVRRHYRQSRFSEFQAEEESVDFQPAVEMSSSISGILRHID